MHLIYISVMLNELYTSKSITIIKHTANRPYITILSSMSHNDTDMYRLIYKHARDRLHYVFGTSFSIILYLHNTDGNMQLNITVVRSFFLDCQTIYRECR